MPKLTDGQCQHIIELLERGESLPLDYKHILFPPERREYELVYAGKDREEDVIAETMAVPLQSIRNIGGNGSDWHNLLIFGDNLQAMKTLLTMKERGLLTNGDGSRGVRLVYIDPPFATKQQFQSNQDQDAYRDKIVGAAFLEFLRKRLVLIRELLVDEGFLVVHIDYRYGHYVKVLLDELFPGGFRNDIKIPRGTKNVQNQFEEITSLTTGDDSLLLYAKSAHTKIPHLRIELDTQAAGKWDTFWRGTDRPTMRYRFLGQMPRSGQWRWKKSRALEAKKNYEEYLANYEGKMSLDEYYLDRLDKGSELDFVRKNKEGVVQYFVPPRDSRIANTMWTNIRTIGRVTSYPTEKHEELLARIVGWLSAPNDIVLDAFSGSGTTAAVAEKYGRRWIAIDCGKLAIYTIQKRMLNLKVDIANKGEVLKPKPFILFNAGLYDFARLKELPWDAWRSYALGLFQCQDKPHRVSGIQLDGFRGSDDVLVFNHRLGGGVVLDYGFIDDLHAQIGSRVGARFFIVAPAASVTFLEDYVARGRTRYYILRIPYSIINELHNRDFTAITQPVDEMQVNDTVEAVGFDFIRPPKVTCKYFLRKTKGEMFNLAIVKIETFKSEAMAKGASEKGNLETLSMVLVDYDYPYDPNRKGKEAPPPLELDQVFFANEIKAADWEVRLLLSSIGRHMMLIYVDIYGNEYAEIKTLADFGNGRQKSK